MWELVRIKCGCGLDSRICGNFVWSKLMCDVLLLQLMRMDRSIIEGLQDIVSLLEDQLKPLVQSELSLLVDILYRPELLFPPGTEARKRCESGGFIRRYGLNRAGWRGNSFGYLAFIHVETNAFFFGMISGLVLKCQWVILVTKPTRCTIFSNLFLE